MKRVNWDVRIMLLLTVIVLIGLPALLWATSGPVTWEWEYKARYVGQPIQVRQDVVGRLEMFAQRQPRELSTYLFNQLSGTPAGRMLLKNMCAKMDAYVLAQCGRQLPAAERSVLDKAAAGYDVTPENILAPEVQDATAPVNLQ